MTTNNTPATDILTLLHQYNTLHSTANAHLKSSLWNITKARRGRASQSLSAGGTEYSADDVREELRASALLEWKDGENDDGRNAEVNNSSGGLKGSFVLHLDGMKEASQQQQQQQQQSTNPIPSEHKENEGLRRRRNPNRNPSTAENDSTDNKWTSEEPHLVEEDDDDELRLRTADPLHLFGVPPPALRVAQRESRSAVAYYVEVANLAREILEVTTTTRAR